MTGSGRNARGLGAVRTQDMAGITWHSGMLLCMSNI